MSSTNCENMLEELLGRMTNCCCSNRVLLDHCEVPKVENILRRMAESMWYRIELLLGTEEGWVLLVT